MIDIRQLKCGGSDAAMKVLLEEADRIIEACAKMIEGYKKLFV